MSRKLLLVFGAVLLSAAIWSPSGASGSPSRFTFEVCDPALPGGNAQGLEFHGDSGVFAGFNDCASGGYLGIRETGPGWGTFGYLSVPVPATAGGYVESLAITAQACGMGPTNTNPHVYEDHWPPPICHDLLRYIHVHSGPFPYAPGGNFSIVLNCEALYDNTPNHNPINCQPGPVVGARYIAATEVDPKEPELNGLAGSLLEGGQIRGHQTISIDAADTGGGLSQLFVLVNGVRAGGAVSESCNSLHVSNPSFYGTVSNSVRPCPATGGGEWTLDTQAYPFRDGANSVTVCAEDFSTLNDPNQTCTAPARVAVDNSCTPSAVAGGELLSAEFESSHTDTYTAKAGRGAVVSGQLSTNADDPVAGATLCVKEATPGVDRGPRSVAVLRTDANGSFRYEVRPGANRQIVIGYRHDSRQVARSVRFYAHLSPSLKLSPARLRNGKTVQMWGTIPGPEPGLRIVVLQANVVGSKRWITFRKASTDGKGAFKASYKFKSTTRRVRYRFRAVVPRQDDYPYVGGASRPASVVVRP